jgi:hypothetical protein
MACIIPRPDPQTLFDRYSNMFSSNVLGGAPVVPESNEWYATSLNYAMAEEFYAISEQQWRERDPRYACCDNLFDLAAQDGVYPHPAAAAQGYVILRGVPNSPLPSSFEVSANGQTYISASILLPQLPTSGTLTVRVQAVSPGPAGNAAGTVTVGTLTTPIAGIENEVTVCGGSFCGGADPEECEPFRQRYLARKQYTPRANQSWAIQTLESWPCVTRAMPRGGNCCTCEGEGGMDCTECGTGLDFYVMMDGAFPCGVPPQNILDEISEWFFGANPGRGEGIAEIGMCGDIVQPRPFEVDVVLDIVGACPTASQLAVIQGNVNDMFQNIVPSTDVPPRQIEAIVIQVMGPMVDVTARFVIVNDADIGTRGSVAGCGDLVVTCDSLPCLRSLRLVGPGITSGGSCA